MRRTGHETKVVAETESAGRPLDGGPEQPHVELGQHVLAPDGPVVPLPLDREVDQLRPHRRWRQGLAAFAHPASVS
jgi:hypothetical protein